MSSDTLLLGSDADIQLVCYNTSGMNACLVEGPFVFPL